MSDEAVLLPWHGGLLVDSVTFEIILDGKVVGSLYVEDKIIQDGESNVLQKVSRPQSREEES